MAQALLRLGARALSGPLAWALAVAAFLGLFVLQLPFPLIVIGAALIGGCRGDGIGVGLLRPRHTAVEDAAHCRAVGGRSGSCRSQHSGPWRRAGSWPRVGLFFAKLAVVTFGGAYAVLAWMVQEVVQDFGWLTTAQMMDALGLAETTPGPLILVTEFVGFLAGGAGGWPLDGPRCRSGDTLG